MNHPLHRTGRTAALAVLAGLTLLAPSFGMAASHCATLPQLAAADDDQLAAALPLRQGHLELVSHDVDVVINNNGFATKPRCRS